MQDSIRVEKGDTLFTCGPIGSFQIKIVYEHADTTERAVRPDSQRVWIAMTKHEEEVQQWKVSTYACSAVALLEALVLVWAIFKLNRMRKYFK